ncbi:MAG: twin transmembrane helix small protein [Proteobacteria bacterium]|nr:twin transmembrane helix small protein [Pseudomonadota bacterium]
MFTKALVIIVMIVILFSLGSALFYLIQDKGKTDRTIKALTWRIALSVGLFIFLMICFMFGLITPHGINS